MLLFLFSEQMIYLCIMVLRIKEVARSRGITMRQIAKKLNTNYQTITHYNSGFRTPTLGKLKDIANILNCEIHELIETSEEYAHFYDNKTSQWLGIRKK